jgi:hypothetical protein
MFVEISQHKPELKFVYLGWHGTLNKKDNALKKRGTIPVGMHEIKSESYQFFVAKISIERWSQLSLNTCLLSGSSLSGNK